MNLDFAGMRREYDKDELLERDAAAEPFEQFHAWMQAARGSGLQEPNAMALATVGADGAPSNRMVLLKELDATGFVFFTNYRSRKARELDDGAPAALVFWWDALHRQVRIEGRSERVAAAESDAYFAKRPLGSRIGAIVSPQSAPIEGRAGLEAAFEEASARLGDDPPRPEHWGGYRIVPHCFEFWQGRRSRLHDRLLYTREGDGWRRERLAP